MTDAHTENNGRASEMLLETSMKAPFGNTESTPEVEKGGLSGTRLELSATNVSGFSWLTFWDSSRRRIYCKLSYLLVIQNKILARCIYLYYITHQARPQHPAFSQLQFPRGVSTFTPTDRVNGCVTLWCLMQVIMLTDTERVGGSVDAPTTNSRQL